MMQLKSSIKSQDILSCLERFQDLKIMVFGDIILDVYLQGEVKRISPEAPVPVLQFRKETFLLGGSGNVASNLSRLGVQVFLSGIISEDKTISKNAQYTSELVRLIQEKGLSCDTILKSNKVNTIVKTRVIAQTQQIVRIDREDGKEFEDALITQLFEKIHKLKDKLDGIIISDYGKGLVNKKTLPLIVDFAKKNNIFISLDPKQKNFPFYKDIDVMTPNHHEASEDIDLPCETNEEVIEAGLKILDKHNLKQLILTRGEKGMTLFDRDSKNPPQFLPAFNQSLYDVSGAGDTVIAIYTASYLVSKDHYLAAFIANICAAIVVSKFGTSTVSLEQVKEFILKNKF